MTRFLLPAATLAWREVIRFCRQRSRIIGAFGQPLLFWVLLGAGFRASFRPPGLPAGTGYLEYAYPGILGLVLLFTAIFATFSVVEDRREGFLQGVLVAPVPRSALVLGQAVGATLLAVGQGTLILALAPAAGVPLTPLSAAAGVAVMVLVAFGMVCLGLLLAWRMESAQGFHGIINLILLPMWLLSGAFFPLAGAPAWLAWAMRLNPLTYGIAALRRALYLGSPAGVGPVPALLPALGITALFAVAAFAAAAAGARRAK
jgi:ABC-2 type transport system permease protein